MCSLLISATDGRVVPLSRERMQQLWSDLKTWLSILNVQSEVFSGETMLTRLESLQTLSKLVRSLVMYALLIHT